jgi:hypothetical protein
MIDNDLYTLVNQVPDRKLDRLEADIWRRIEGHTQNRRLGRVIASCQLMAMVVALAGSAAFGAAEATSYHARQKTIYFTDVNLAPSMLLLGRAP